MRHVYANFNWCLACYSHSESRPQKVEFIPPKVGHKNCSFLRNVITTTHALGRWEVQAAEGTTLDFPTQSVSIGCPVSALNNSVLLHVTAEGGKSLKCVWRSEEGKEASSPSHISGYTSFLPRPSYSSFVENEWTQCPELWEKLLQMNPQGKGCKSFDSSPLVQLKWPILSTGIYIGGPDRGDCSTNSNWY